MSIDLSILKDDPLLAKSIKLEVNGADLLAFGRTILQQAIAESDKLQKCTEKYLTPKQYANELQVSVVTLWHWDKKGIIHPLKIGNKKRYRMSDLEKIMQPVYLE